MKNTRASVKQKYGLITALVVVISFVFYSAVFTTHTQAATGTNQQLNYQGRLLDISGAVVADGLYNMEFKIYQDGTGCVGGGSPPCGGTLMWTETYIQTNRVTVKNGYFSVNLASLTAFGSSVDWNQDTLWLSINIGGTTNTPTPTWDGEMTQYKRLTSTPYALNSAQLGGLTAANFLQLAQGVQNDTSISNPSIFVNKNNASLTPNIVQLQKAGSDVFVVDNGGSLSVTPSDTAATISLGTASQTGTITLGQYNGASTSIINIGNNAGASSTQQVNIASSATGISTLVLGSSSSTSTTTIRGGTGGININPNGSSNTGLIIAPANNSTAAFQLQSASAADTLLTADTTNNKLVVGNATGTNSATTQLIVDAATIDPTSGYNGAIYYNSTNDKFRCYQAAVWADCLGATQNSTLNVVSGLANVGANVTGVAVETLVFTTATSVSNTAGATGFTAAAGGSFRTCLIKNNAAVTAGTLDLRWRVNGASVGAGACQMDSTVSRSSSSALDAGVVTFSQGDTIGIAFDTVGMAPTTVDFTVFWTIEYNSTLTNAGATLQSAYDNFATITTTDTHDLLVNAADTATDANVLFNLQCVTSCSTNGRFAVQNAATDVFTVNPNSGNIVLAPAGAGDATFTGDNDSNLQISTTFTGTGPTINPVDIILTHNATAAGTSYGLSITNADNGVNAGVPAALAYLHNANAAETVANGLLVEQTGAGTLTNGIEIRQTAGTVTSGLAFTGTFGSVLSVGGTTVINASGQVPTGRLTGNYVANAATSVLTGLAGGSAGSTGASLNLAFDYSQALSGDVGLGADAAVFGQSGLVFEGSAADTSETFIAVTNPTSDHTFTFPDVASGNVCISNVACVSTSGTAGTFTANYVASVATTGGLSGGAAGSNAAALSLSIDQAASLTWTGTEAFNGATTFSPSGTNDVTLTLDADSFLIVGSDSINDFTGGGLAVSAGALGVLLDSTAADGSSTTSVSGLEIVGGEVSLIRGCAAGDVLKWDNTNFEWDCGADAGAGAAPFASAGGIITKSTSTDRVQLTIGEAGDYGLLIDTSVVPTADMLSITNAGQAVTTAGVSGLQITYVGGAAAVESSGQKIDLTGGTTAGGTWNGLWVTQGTITAGTTIQDIKLETAALTSTSGTSIINGLNLATAGAINSSTAGSIDWSALNVTTPNITQGAGGTATATGVKVTVGTLTTGGTQYGINITGSSSNAAGTEVGLNISNITGGAASESGISIGTGWDNELVLSDTTPTLKLNATDNTAIFSITDNAATPNTLLRLQDNATNFGASVEAGAFIDYNSHYEEEWNKGAAQVAIDTVNIGDKNEWSFNETGTCLFDRFLDTANGIMRLTANLAASSCSSQHSDTGAATPNLLWDADLLPTFVMKVRPGVAAAGVPDTDHQFFAGVSDGGMGAAPASGAPTNGIYFTNASDTAGVTGTANWYAKTDSGAAAQNTACGVAVQETAYALLIIKVMSTSLVKFYIDNDVSNGVQLVECGTGNTTNINAAGMAGFFKADWDANTNASTLDVDFFRGWQDDAPVVGDGLAGLVLDEQMVFGALSIEAGTLLDDRNALSNLIISGESAPYDPSQQINAQTILASQGIVSPRITANNITTNTIEVATGQSISLRLGAEQQFVINDVLGNELVNFDSFGNVSFSGTITADKIVANQIEGIEILTDKISSLQAKLDKSKEVDAGSSPPSKSNSLHVADLTAVDLSVLADIEAKGGLIVDKDARFNGRTIFALLAEFNGPVKFNGQVSYNSDAGGTALIKKDSKKVTIKFSNEYSGTPIITANYLFKGADSDADESSLQRLLDGGYSFTVSQSTAKGFSIVLNKPATEDIHFTWLANLINKPQISQVQEPPTTSGQ